MTNETARRAAGLLASWVLMLAAPAWAQQPEPLGGEFQINAYTSGAQSFPAIGADAAGDFVVAWTSATEIDARRFDSAGNPLGAEFRVNPYTTGTQTPANLCRTMTRTWPVLPGPPRATNARRRLPRMRAGTRYATSPFSTA